MKMRPVVTFGDIEVDSDLRHRSDGTVVAGPMLIGPVEVRVHLSEIPQAAQKIHGATQINFLDARDPYPYAIEVNARFTDDEAKRVLDVLESVKRRVLAELEVSDAD